MLYTVDIEAEGFGAVLSEYDALVEALPDDSEDVKVVPTVDEEGGMLAVAMTFHADHALDAHEQALDIWRTAWEDAFDGPPMRMAIRVLVGGELPTTEAQELEREDADADLDAELAEVHAEREGR